MVHNRELFQRLSGNEVRGIAGEKRLRCVCFSFDLSSLFRFWRAIVHCFVPRFSIRRRTSLSLSYHSFPLLSELRKRWLVALRRDEGANSRVSESTVRCGERFLRQIFTFLLVPKSLCTLPLQIMAKQGRQSWSLPESRCSAIGFLFFSFFFCAPSLRAPVSNGMRVNYEAEKGTALRESVQLTPVGQMMKPLSIESWPNSERLQRKRSKVCAGSADRAANTQPRACEVTMSVEIITFKKLGFFSFTWPLFSSQVLL